MLKHHIKIAFRNLWKRKTHTLINVFGLSLGLTCCLLIGIYIYEELSYDKHHLQSDRIFRITNLDLNTGKHWAPIGPPVGIALAEQLPEVEAVARFIPVLDGEVLSIGEKQFKESGLLYADSSVFDVFTIPLQQGDQETALSEPNTIVLTQRMARKYFGQQNPIGQSLSLNGRYNLRITGVLDNLPSTTHLPFEGLISMPTFYARAGAWVNDAWTWSAFYTYILLRKGYTAEAIVKRFPAFINSFYEPQGTGPATNDRKLVLQPLTDIHLHSHLEKELHPNGKALYIKLFGFMGLFLLLLAIINFINLSTAQSADRTQEVGVRQTLGARQTGIAWQFIMESVLIVFIAFAVAYLFTQALVPLFGQLSGKTLSGTILTQPAALTAILGMILLLGILAGSYPAFVLARLRPVHVLKGQGLSIIRGIRLRKSLIVIQFVVAIILLVGTAVTYQQIRFFTTTSLGFDKEHLIDIRIGPSAEQEIGRQAEGLKQELLREPNVEAVTLVSGIPGERFPLSHFELSNQPLPDNGSDGFQMRVVFGAESDYISTLGLNILHGRDFTNMVATDSTGAFIVNEAAIQEMNLTPEQVIGKNLHWTNQNYSGSIVGIVEDFHYASLYHQVEPLAIPLRPQFTNSHLLVRIKGMDLQKSMNDIKAIWNDLVPDALFDYAFMDAQIDDLYRSEFRINRVVTTFSFIALLIACLGLFGLTALMVGQRTKEIGIRKVLGASVASVVALLSKDFIRLVLIAIVIATPIAWYAMNRWLQGFAYRIELQWWMFAGAGLVAVVIAMVSVSGKSVRAAMADPIGALRNE